MNDHASTSHVGIGVALLSIALLMTELILTRLFSITILYHFAFFAISVALFGTGTGALLLHLNQHRLPEKYADIILSLSSVALGISILFSNIILVRISPDFSVQATSGSPSTTFELLFIFTAAAAPFFIGGFAISLAMTRYANRIHSLYFFDLLGAGLGCLFVIPALSFTGGPVALIIAAAVASSAGIPFARNVNKQMRLIAQWIPYVTIVLMLSLVAANPLFDLFELHRAKGKDFSSFEVEFNRWNSFSMVSVIKNMGFQGWGLSPNYRGPLADQKSLVIDMNALTPLISFNGDFSSVSHLLYDLSAFVYHIRPNQGGEACVIGAGGGRDVLTALASGTRRVTAVEINPIIANEVVRGKYHDFTGGLYNRPDVTVVIDDGRAFMRSSKQLFDTIQISMVDTSAATAAGAYALTENNLYTVEAFNDYLAHLRHGGFLSVSHISSPTLAGGARLSALAWQSLRNLGIDPSKSVAVIGTPWLNLSSFYMYNIIMKRGVFTVDELTSIRDTAKRLAFSLIYLPSGNNHDPENLIASILNAENVRVLNHLTASGPLDVSPTTDNRPFFFYQNRLGDALNIQSLFKLSGSFSTGLFILVKVLLISAAMVTLFLIIPSLWSRKELSTGEGHAAWDIAYIACLGLGFMCVEIGMLQKFSLYLGIPTYTLSIVLFVLLISGGVGSRLFGRVQPANRHQSLFIIILLLVALLVVVWQKGYDALLIRTVTLPLEGRCVLTALLIAPVGLLLGIPFPAGLSSISVRAGTRIPWLWAINSGTSVLGSVLATIISIHAGISFALLAGLLLYTAALFLSLKVTQGIPFTTLTSPPDSAHKT